MSIKKKNNLNHCALSAVNKKLEDDVEEYVNNDDYESLETNSEQEETIELYSNTPNPRNSIRKEKVFVIYISSSPLFYLKMFSSFQNIPHLL